MIKEDDGMKRIASLVACLTVLLGACQLLTNRSPIFDTGISGRVYSIGAPAITKDWTPPPLEQVSTIIVEDSKGNTIKTSLTDSLGKYKIQLLPGTYYLQVKESLLPAKTGPFAVKNGTFTKTEADYDNGMR